MINEKTDDRVEEIREYGNQGKRRMSIREAEGERRGEKADGRATRGIMSWTERTTKMIDGSEER